MMKCIAVSGVLLATMVGTAVAQNVVAKPGQGAVQGGRTTPLHGQSGQIRRQAQGNFPKFKRSVVPLGVINEKWAKKCSENDSIVHMDFDADKELRVRARIWDGVVLRFDEPVASMVKGKNGVVEVKPWKPGGEKSRSKLWILQAVNAGALTNLVFQGGRGDDARVYAIRVQTEGVNTKNCPDLVVNIRLPEERIKQRAARLISGLDNAERLAAGDDQSENQTSAAPDSLSGLKRDAGSADSGDGTGRQKIDWVEGARFDPTQINLDWKMRGLSDASLEIAPDVVYSDCCFMYLKYDDDRLKRMARPTVSRLNKINRGGDDIETEGRIGVRHKGNFIIVEGVQPITLEIEGIVVCIHPEKPLTLPADQRQWKES